MKNLLFIVFVMCCTKLIIAQDDTLPNEFNGKSSEEIFRVFSTKTRPSQPSIPSSPDPNVESDRFFKEQVKKKYPRRLYPQYYNYDSTSGTYKFKPDILDSESSRLRRNSEKKVTKNLNKNPEVQRHTQSFADAGVTPPIFPFPIPIPYVGSPVYTVKSTLEDHLSTGNYTKMLQKNSLSLVSYIALKKNIDGLAKVIKEEKESLENIHVSMGLISGATKNLIIARSKKYFKKSHLILNPVNIISGMKGRNFSKTSIITARYNYKIKKENDYIDNYLDADNPMSEGQRFFLTLSAIKNILKITLENDSY